MSFVRDAPGQRPRAVALGRVALLPALLLSGAALSACGSYPAPLVTPTTFPAPTTLPPANATQPGNTALPHNKVLSRAALGRDVCAILRATTVQHVVGSPVTGTTDTSESLLLSAAANLYATGNQCAYTTASDRSSPAVLVTLIVVNAAPSYNVGHLRARDDGHPSGVPGTGQKAFYSQHSLAVFWHGYEIIVRGTPDDSRDSPVQDVALAKSVIADLTPEH